MQKNHSAEALDVSVVWPWFAGGALTPVLADALGGPLASFLAAGLSFFLCFAVASSWFRATPVKAAGSLGTCWQVRPAVWSCRR
jgi:hypothetical protein